MFIVKTPRKVPFFEIGFPSDVAVLIPILETVLLASLLVYRLVVHAPVILSTRESWVRLPVREMTAA
jgi:hypothetical protein